MSEQMPRIWWSPSWGRFYTRDNIEVVFADDDAPSAINRFPADAVELVAGDTEYAVSAVAVQADFYGPFIETCSREESARDLYDVYAHGADAHWHRDVKLLRRTVVRSEWQEVTD